MHVRSQWLVGEVLLPLPWGEFGDTAGGVLSDTLQHIDQVGVGVDALHAAGGDQTLGNADMAGAQFGPAEQPVLAPHRNGPQAALQMVGVDRNVRIAQEQFQPGTAFARIGQRLGEGIAGQKALAFELLIDPLEQGLDSRFAVTQSMQALVLPAQALIADVLLDGIQFGNRGQRVSGRFRVGLLCLEELAPGVRPAQNMCKNPLGSRSVSCGPSGT